MGVDLIVKTLVNVLIFFVSLGLITYNHVQTGQTQLFLMFVGLAGLLYLLWSYNRRFTKERRSMYLGDDDE